jgi:GDSL-like Lipase/Acylhydrolase family
MVSDSASRTAEIAPAPDRPRVRQPVRVRRELASWPTLVLVLVCVLVALPLTIMFTPDQRVTVAGQDVYVGARRPSFSLSGPSQLVQVGNTELDIAPLRVWGPLRPKLTLGPVRRNAAAAAALDPSTGGDVRKDAVSSVAGAFVEWYLWAALILLAITIALIAFASCLRMLVTLFRESRASHEPLTTAEVWHRSHSQIRAMSITTLAVTLAAWASCGLLAYDGAVSGLKKVTSLTDLVGTYYLTPSPVGPLVEGYVGAVIGDSRASRAGGPALAQPTESDQACTRSADSLANELSSMISAPVANLACPGASVANGLRGPQSQGGQLLPPQVGLLKQLSGLKFVVVMVGPNDLSWGDQLRYCYGVADCHDRLTEGEYVYRLSEFDRNYGDLLHDLNDLPGSPKVIIVNSYDVFGPGASCPDAAGPPGAIGLSPQNIELLISRNRALNDVINFGARKYKFPVAAPVLTPLCQSGTDGLGPDIQGLADPAPFHPTGVGMLRIASATARLITPS